MAYKLLNNGIIRSFNPVFDVHFGDISCSNKKFINLYPDGSLLECTLAKAYKLDETILNENEKVLLDKTGEVYPYSIKLHREFINNPEITKLKKRKFVQSQKPDI